MPSTPPRGPTRLGNMRRVEVNRRTGERVTLDLYPYLLEGDVDQDVILEQGDNVHIPLRGRRVQMRGAVVRPAYYELAESDALIDVLRNAGGFGPEALRRRLTIHRVLLPADRGSGLADRQAIDLELRASADSTLPNYMGGVLIPPDRAPGRGLHRRGLGARPRGRATTSRSPEGCARRTGIPGTRA